jgi:hypothetical protein
MMQHADRQHAKLSPSASHRWISCPGSIKLCEKVPPQKSSSYAEEGTRAHELAELCLKEGVDAGVKTDKLELADAVQVYLDAVREKMNAANCKLDIETRFSLEWLHPGMFGSNDAAVYKPDSKHLAIFDYKHGQGVAVEAEWNTQLMIYAVGAAYKIWQDQTAETKRIKRVLDFVETVELVIVQPRAPHTDGPIRRFTLSARDLFFWALHILKPAAEMTENQNAQLCTGAHCRFCPAIAVCPEQIKTAVMVAKTTFEKPILPSPESLTPTDMAKVLAVSSVISAWADEVKAYAHGLAERGHKIPGFKLVQKKANRAWLDDVEASSRLEGLLGEAAYEKKLLSVAKAEAAVKKMKLSPESALAGLWHKPDTGLSFVAETDARKEVLTNPAIAFLADADFLS